MLAEPKASIPLLLFTTPNRESQWGTEAVGLWLRARGGQIFLASRALIAFAILAALSSPAAAQAPPPLVRQLAGLGTIDGVVTDTMLVPLTGSTISILGSNVRVVTGDNGRFRISALQAGEYIVVAHRLGYEPLTARVTVTLTDTARLAFALDRVVVRLDTVMVEETGVPARFAEFESRLKNHDATAAFTAEDIHKVNPVDAWQMVSRVPSVKFIPKGANGGMFAASARGAKMGGPCYMAVMIDGLTMPAKPGEPGFNLADLPRPDEIHGIEVFAGAARIPVQYNSLGGGEHGTSRMCGLIAIWTK